MSSELKTRDLLAALQLPNVGPSTVRKLWARRSEFVQSTLLQRVEAVLAKRAAPLTQLHLDQAFERADQILAESGKLEIQTLSPLDDAFPKALLDLADFPPVIYVKGDLSTLLNPQKIAVVGTREASDLGLKLARKIASELSNLNYCVVSGLALGIDSAAHTGAIKGPGSTIAVLAHGLDQIAPRSNESLAASILENRGVLLSEHEIGVIPRGPQFVARNRLQSGLSRASIVVESGATGGSIYQGKFTTDQKRLLFVVMPDETLPGSSDFRREGGERLAKEYGAKKISKLDDMLALVARHQESEHLFATAEKVSVPPEKSTPAVHAGHVVEQLTATDSLQAKAKSSLAVHHLYAANYFAGQAERLEQSASDRDSEAADQVRAFSIGSVLASVAFLEAEINDIFVAAADGASNSPFNDFVQTEAVAAAWRDPMRKSWSLLEKYQRALEASGQPPYSEASRVRGEVESLIHLRNSLVHYAPEWDDDLKRHKGVEKRLAGKFRENRYSHESQAYFPHRALGAGCARWAVTAAVSFVEDVRRKLQVSENRLPLHHPLLERKSA